MESESGTTTITEQPSQGAAPDAGQQPSQGAGFDFNAWQPDQWDALPERIRQAADARYNPQIQEREQRLTSLQRDLQSAKKEAEDARARWLSGNPYGAEDVKKAQAELAAIKAEFDAYKGKFHQGVIDDTSKSWQGKWEEAVGVVNSNYAARLNSEIGFMFPWSVQGTKEAPNPNYDAAAMAEADRLTELIDNGLALDGVPDAVILTAAKMNEAQRHTFVQALAESGDWRSALSKAQAPPAPPKSPAARLNEVSAPAPRPSRDRGAPGVDRSALRSASDAARAQGAFRGPTT